MARLRRIWRALLKGDVSGAIRSFRPSRPEIRALRPWQRVLVAQMGARPARRLLAALRRRYAALLAQQPLPAHPALRRHVTDQILPGLALYQVLLAEHAGDQPAALAALDRLFRAKTLAQYRLLLLPLRVLPTPFWLIRLAFGRRMLAFPPDGWDFEPVENSASRIAFNTYRCFYLDTLSAYGTPELTAAFCKTDEVMAELLPPSVRFARSQTLAQGGQVCDFQYCKMTRSSAAN